MSFKNYLPLVSLVLLIATQAIWAQPKWEKEAVGNFNLSNAYYHDWAAGGENTVSMDLKLNGTVERDDKKTNWSNNLKIDYGQVKLGGDDFQKSLDEFYFESLLGYKISKEFSPYVALKVQSQFTEGYQYTDTSSTLVSNFWDPGYITQSVGMAYSPPVKKLMVRLGFSLKETFSRDHGYADDDETANEIETFKIEPGLEGIVDFKRKLNEIVKYETKLSTFVNFKGVDKIDGRWENTITAQVSKYINVNFSLEMLYDYDLSDTHQIKQALALGLNYTFL